MTLIGNNEDDWVPLRSFRFSGTTLQLEMDKISKVRNRKTSEAVAFFAGRILEGSAADSIHRLGYTPGREVSDHLVLIGLSGRCDDGYIACGNALRRIGNDARHLNRLIEEQEEATIIGLLQLWVEWYLQFLDKPLNAEFQRVFNDWSPMTTTIRMLVKGDHEKIKALNDNGQFDESKLLGDPITAAFVGERLIDSRLQIADAFTSKAADRYQNIKRVQQVRALFHSRNNRPDLAIKTLERVLRLKYGKDGETLGILGGAYKNLWLSEKKSIELQKAFECYSQPANDDPTNYYRHINAAATALWLGRNADARSEAFKAEECLKQYGITVSWALSTKTNYWLVATLAEAKLIEGKKTQAAKLYEHARSIDKTGGRWERTLTQLLAHLNFMPSLHKHFEHLFLP